MISFGNDLEKAVLSDWSIEESFDGTVNGSATFTIDAGSSSSPEIGETRHPKDDRLILVDFRASNNGNETIVYECRFFGISANQGRSTKIWTYGTSMNEESIEAHPDASNLIGDKDDKKNGAQFDKDGVFLGFAATSSLAGVRGYLSPTTTLRSTWYDEQATTGADTIGKLFKFTTDIPGLKSTTRNALKIGWSAEQIGLTHYRITEEFLLSDVGTKWKKEIYGSEVNL
jgi:hypothetical protein